MSKFFKETPQEKIAKVAIISLDGAVNLYADTLSFIAWKLQTNGVDVVRFGCNGMLESCTSINSTGRIELRGDEKEKICQRCRTAQQEITSKASIEVDGLDELADENAVRFLNEVKERLAFGRKVVDVLDMSYAGMPLCRIAFFDYSIVTKLGPDSALDPAYAARFVAGVNDLLKLLHAFERFSKKYEVTHIVYVNGNYTQNTLARYVFGKKGVVCLSVEPQLTSQHVINKVVLVPDRLTLHPESLFQFNPENLLIDNNALADTRNLLANFGARIKGKDFNAYTSLDGQSVASEEVTRFEKFLDAYKRINSFFLSSEDELTPHAITHDDSEEVSLNPLGPYKTQFEFTAYLLEEAARHPEIGFLIRLHPRMAPNKRDSFESEEHHRYKSLIAGLNLPDNILVLYGDSKISSYFVISKSDLVVVSWSTIGLEALLLGLPVISAFPSYLMYPLTRLSNQPKNQDEMEKALFGNANLGVADDKKLLGWMSMAFEGQFFVTAAPRQGGLLGRFYRVIYRLTKRAGMSSLIYWLADTILPRRALLNSERLLHRRETETSVAEDCQLLPLQLLEGYRVKYKKILQEYGLKIQNAR